MPVSSCTATPSRGVGSTSQPFVGSRRSEIVLGPEAGDAPYTKLIDAPPSYSLSSPQRTVAHDETNRLTDLGKAMSALPLHEGTPRPEPDLVIRPSF
jgi:hypothetical protein